MKSELKAKFLQHILDKKKGDEGFTLIELLVVIIIIGILSAIALPSFLNQANKAKQSEAKTYVGSMNRAQQAYYLENTSFSTSIGTLGLGIATQTVNYKYDAVAGDASTINNRGIVLNGTAPLKAYIGAVEVTTQQATSEATTVAILCEAKNAMVNNGKNADDSAAAITYTAGAPVCPSTDFISLAK
ncbi:MULTISPECIES: type IV pilin-like G/H family protein [unclassified Nostoc]|uniref:type IV pilin-like G/H family protein n=1 Tax=unclassified Nostoc TaxID=2593658 RepID=UPI002AD3EB96|nr:type IV pilin-like G/H family protein [Nostoc sp. DedQUE03]MDZ7975604.1 type IV pilin-like G/H family protein [Nostoc sp. DedQUE03]MDZ8045434.1 type IV pilin-like G/H family protein [Nostoc sp. DedQUE02]